MHDRSITGDLKVGTRRMDNASGDREVLTPYQLPVVRCKRGQQLTLSMYLTVRENQSATLNYAETGSRGPPLYLVEESPRPLGRWDAFFNLPLGVEVGVV